MAIALWLIALVLLLDVRGAGTAVIRRITSRSLGTLAPGYAATPAGFKIYAALIGTIGLMVSGVATAAQAPLGGAIVFAAGLVTFVVLSTVAVMGELKTYRALKR